MECLDRKLMQCRKCIHFTKRERNLIKANQMDYLGLEESDPVPCNPTLKSMATDKEHPTDKIGFSLYVYFHDEIKRKAH